jgi:Sec-independent protein translocase protein TatA
MFGFGWIEIAIVAVLGMLVVGVGRFPSVTRQAGQAAGLFQRYRKMWMKLKRLLRLGL